MNACHRLCVYHGSWTQRLIYQLQTHFFLGVRILVLCPSAAAVASFSMLPMSDKLGYESTSLHQQPLSYPPATPPPPSVPIPLLVQPHSSPTPSHRQPPLSPTNPVPFFFYRTPQPCPPLTSQSPPPPPPPPNHPFSPYPILTLFFLPCRAIYHCLDSLLPNSHSTVQRPYQPTSGSLHLPPVHLCHPTPLPGACTCVQAAGSQVGGPGGGRVG